MSRIARLLALGLAVVSTSLPLRTLLAQEPEVEVERPDPPALEDFETDANKDGVPDRWYNLRDARVESKGGIVGPHYLKFECRKPGRPARLSRGFGVDGRKTEALIIGMWVRVDQLQAGERLGEDPGFMIDFLGDKLRALTRGVLGPWTAATVGTQWTRVSKRIPVPPETRDAIMSIGLMGGTGILDVDGLTITQVPVGGQETTNLVLNGDFELGDPDPASWNLENGAVRAFPSGAPANSVLEFARSGSRALTLLGVPVAPFGRLEVSLMVRASGLRGAGGAVARLFFLDDSGAPLPGNSQQALLFRWSGSITWHPESTVVAIPEGAVRAVLQFEKTDSTGVLYLDDVSVTASPNPNAGAWTPYHVEDDKSLWLPVKPSPTIAANSALDASYLLDAPAGKHGFVIVKDHRLAFSRGGRARFFGVVFLPPASFLDPERADKIADRLARSGINLVRLSDLDEALGPARSLFDDSRDDTKAFDPVSLERLDHLIAALKKRGIYIALELQSARRFRSEDGVKDVGLLPLGGGPAATFDPRMHQLAIDAAIGLLNHVNKETGLPLRLDPTLAWVTLGGELTLFDRTESRLALPRSYADQLREIAQKRQGAIGPRSFAAIEHEHWKDLADRLRKDKVRVPIAAVSHWRREPPEFVEMLHEPGFDLVDDRLYVRLPALFAPERRSMLWSLDGGFVHEAARKRRADRPYVVGQWCFFTQGAWGLPIEAADEVLAAALASDQDWDALVRRGIFLHPDVWGSAAAGTGGTEDIYQIPEVINGLPQVYSLWPHTASLMLRGRKAAEHELTTPHHLGSQKRIGLEGWDPSQGRLVVNTPFTLGIAGWHTDNDPVSFSTQKVAIETSNPFGVVMVSATGTAPIASSKRLLVTAIARIEPTGLRWVDNNKRDVADPGRPPLLQEPVVAKVRWNRKGSVKAYALDNTGARIEPARLDRVSDGFELSISGQTPILHWELVEE